MARPCRTTGHIASALARGPLDHHATALRSGTGPTSGGVADLGLTIEATL